MRRLRIIVPLMTAVSLLILPGQGVSAQTPARVERLEALIAGQTAPPQDAHMLGVNRVVDPSEFEPFTLTGVLLCDDHEVVEFDVPGTSVRFQTDDDITDGVGRIDSNQMLIDPEGTAHRVGALPALVRIEVTILDGEIHRLLNYVDVDLRLHITVTRGGDPICEDEEHEVRIVFLIVGPSLDLTTGFTLVGLARTHEVPDERTSMARTVCENIDGAFTNGMRLIVERDNELHMQLPPGTPRIRDIHEAVHIRISGDHRVHAGVLETGRPGRHQFHPCRANPQ